MFMNGFTDKQWQAFGLRIQDKISLTQTAETMKISRAEVRQLLKDMKESEHGRDLFPVESDKHALGRSVKMSARPQMLSYTPSMDDGSIKAKW